MKRVVAPVIALLLVLAFTLPTQIAQSASFFAETGRSLDGAFLDYWNAHGGLAQFGYPITDKAAEDGRTVQYLERAVFEYWPENPDPYKVQLRLLGNALAQGRENEQPFKRRNSVPSSDHLWYFPETGHTLSWGFLTYWLSHGGLNIYGYPISEEFDEVSPTDGKTYTVQYFQRNRFEYHSEFKGTQYETLLGLLGSEYYRLRTGGPPPGAQYPDGRIAYLDPQMALWVSRPDGSDAVKISRPGHIVQTQIEWSPDGRSLTYEADYNIFIAAAGGSGARQITSQGRNVAEYQSIVADSPSWSPDGRWLAYPVLNDTSDRSVQSGLWVVESAGGEPSYLGEADFVEGWTPGGSVVTSRLVLPPSGGNGTWTSFVVDRLSGEQNKLAEGTQVAISPAGSQLAFTVSFTGGATANIFAADLAGSSTSHVRQLTRFGDAQWPSWSPDGQRIAFSVLAPDDKSQRDVYVMDADGGNQKKVARGYVWSPNPWSPDGQMLVFMATTGDTREVHTVKVDGTGERKLGAGDAPTWSTRVVD